MNELSDIVKERLTELQNLATEKWGRVPISISISLTGRVAGRATPVYDNGILTGNINLNFVLMMENLEEFLKRTIPHEMAHIYVCQRDKNQMTRFNHGHDLFWQNTCYELGMTEVTRCHNYDTSNTARNTQKFEYRLSCGCTFSVGLKIHRHIQSGEIRRCTSHHSYVNASDYISGY